MIAQTRAVVLRTMEYKESSRIARLFTEDFGKISVIAKGVRGPRGRFAAALEPMNVVGAVIYKKERAELHLLTQCETLAPLTGLRTDLLRMQAGMAMVELADVVSHPDDPNPLIFNLLMGSLETADHATSRPDLAFYRFEARLLDLLGFRPGLELCVSCGRRVTLEPVEDGNMPALAEAGVVCSSCARRGAGGLAVAPATLLLLQRLMEPGDSGNALMETSRDAAAPAGRALQWLYGVHVHGYKGLKSEGVFRALGATR